MRKYYISCKNETRSCCKVGEHYKSLSATLAARHYAQDTQNMISSVRADWGKSVLRLDTDRPHRAATCLTRAFRSEVRLSKGRGALWPLPGTGSI